MSTANVVPIAPESPESATLMERHRSAYQAAKRAASLADSVKYGSIFVAGLVFIVAILIYQAVWSERFGFPVISISLVVGASLLVFITYLWSIVLRHRARVLEIAIDAAVNSSLQPNARRATIIGPAGEASTPEKKGKEKTAA